MNEALVQTAWAELAIGTLRDAGVATIVVSPGSRSTPLVAALRGDVVTIIDERAAAFYALGVARATGSPAALICTSGTAGAHYLPAIVEASAAAVPLIAITADRPPELIACGASQTIDQVKLFGGFVRGAFDLGAPAASELALRAVRRKLVQAVTLARGPHPGPVHVEVPLRKPLEPAEAATDAERALVATARAMRGPVTLAVPRLTADPAAIDALVAAIDREPDGAIVVGALPVGFAVDAIVELAARAGYPLIVESGSQLRFGVLHGCAVDALDVVPLARRPDVKLVVQIGGEPVAASWPAWSAGRPRWVLAQHAWHDPDSSARGVVVGDATAAIAARVTPRANPGWLAGWRAIDREARGAIDAALEAHAGNEGAIVRAAVAAMPPGAILQVGNSLPIRVIDQVARREAGPRAVITQRGAAGIDGLIASAAGATAAGAPVLLVLGDVSFAHDLGALVAARAARAPLAIVVVDNGGGQIFAGLPIARTASAELVARHFTTPPAIDPVAVALALGARGVVAHTPREIGAAVASALATAGVTVIHAPASPSGAHDIRRTAHELLLRTS